MGNSAPPISVADLIDHQVLVINDGYRAKNSELSPEGLPFARAQNINNGFHFEDADCFPAQDLSRVGIKVSEPGDVVFTSKGTVGRFAFVRGDTPKFVYSPQLCFWRVLDPDRIHPQWLYYWMHSREFFIQLSGMAGQTDMAEYVSLRDQRRMQVTIPPLPAQRAIASILGALDDKIELNRRTNETLEGIARTIFKSWFVDFDPVWEKMARKGKGTQRKGAETQGRRGGGWPDYVLELFPDEFEESELGETPRGWKIESFVENIDVIGGGTPKTSIPEYWGGDIPWFSVADTPRPGEVFVIKTDKSITEAGVRNSSTRILPTGTTIISARGTVGNLALVGVPMAMNQSCYGLRDLRNGLGYYVYFSTAAAVTVLRQRTHGSVFSTITRDTLESIQVIVPPERVVAAYESHVHALLQQILSNLHESRLLAGLRDTLLPKLISGKLRVPDAERIVGRCV